MWANEWRIVSSFIYYASTISSISSQIIFWMPSFESSLPETMTILFSWKIDGFLAIMLGKTITSILLLKSSILTKSIGLPVLVIIFLILEIIPPIFTLTFRFKLLLGSFAMAVTFFSRILSKPFKGWELTNKPSNSFSHVNLSFSDAGVVTDK